MGQMLNTEDMPVFECRVGELATEARERPIDLVHLARQTGGDRVLEAEVLQLFVKQAARIANQVEKDLDSMQRKSAAHTLQGAARAVGAFEVAQCATALEEQPSERACVKALVTQINSTCDYISSLLR